MGWCTRCGNLFLLSSGRYVTRTIGARGRGPGLTDVIDSVCHTCLLPNEVYDATGAVITKELAAEIKRANARTNEQG